MIKLVDINKSFGKKQVLNNISLEIHKNEVLGIVGSNGSGKSTLIEIISKVIKPSSGTVEYNDEIKFGIQYQDGVWPYGTKVKDVINVFTIDQDIRSGDFKKTIEYFEIESIMNKNIQSLSGGQRQRLNCFLAIYNNSNIVVFDELISGLDLKTQDNIMSYIKDIKTVSDKSFIIISHVPEEIELLSDRFIILEKGTITGTHTTKDVVKKYKSVRNVLMEHFQKIEKNK